MPDAVRHVAREHRETIPEINGSDPIDHYRSPELLQDLTRNFS